LVNGVRQAEQLLPSSDDLIVGPLLCSIFGNSDYNVVVIAHHSVSEQLDCKHRGKLHQTIFDPLAPVREVSSREAIATAEKSAPDAARSAMVVVCVAEADLPRASYCHCRFPNSVATD
jgi:hypothetical protein